MKDKEYLDKLNDLNDLIVKANELAKKIHKMKDYNEEIFKYTSFICNDLDLMFYWISSIKEELKKEKTNG